MTATTEDVTSNKQQPKSVLTEQMLKLAQTDDGRKKQTVTEHDDTDNVSKVRKSKFTAPRKIGMFSF